MTPGPGGRDHPQMMTSTPCSEYTVGDLVDHVDQVARGATPLARRDADGLDVIDTALHAAHRDPGWRDHVSGHVRALGEAWDDTSVWRGAGNVPGSDLSNEMWGRIALTELVVHGWDLAVATGQPVELDDPTLQARLDHVADSSPTPPSPGCGVRRWTSPPTPSSSAGSWPSPDAPRSATQPRADAPNRAVAHAASRATILT